MTDDIKLKLLKLLAENPELSQRDASEALGLSLGKTNYVINALIDKGLLKIQNFKNNQNKLSYSYLLTPRGIKEKIRLTVHFYSVKKREYEELKKEVETFTAEEKEAVALLDA
jgi:EPS-associated MarR family transcriptional regulator